MTELKQVYKCQVCGNIVEVLHNAGGTLVCCGQEMKLLEEKTQDEGQEKHLPVIKVAKDEVSVKVGSVQHPMDNNHFIEWIELVVNDHACRQKLNPGDKPEAIFKIATKNIKKIYAREYCNVHGLWRSK